MKRFLLSLALCLCSLTAAFAQFSGSGSGTENDPYLIFYADQLTQVRNFLGKSGVYFKLMSDIDLADWIEENSPNQGWQPIGVSSSKFQGIFDGNNHTISNLNINRPSADGVGLFGYANGATFKNIVIDETTITGNGDVGPVCGNASSSTFSNCKVTATINAKGNTVGGIAGSASGTFTNNKVTNTTINGNDNVGGIVGYTGNATFTSNDVSAMIGGKNQVGGILGNSSSNCSFDNNIVKCNIVGVDNVGGLIGEIMQQEKVSLKTKKCAFYGTIKAHSRVGGVIGLFYSFGNCDISNCYSICDIQATGDRIGGILGHKEGGYSASGSISNSYHSGNILGGVNVGGIVGDANRVSITKCQSLGSVNANSHVGGVVGCISGGEYYVYYSQLKQNVALTTTLLSTNEVGRIYGIKGDYSTIGILGSSDDNLALSTMIVSKAGVVQEVNDNEQNGTSMSSTGLKLKANYVAHGWDFNNDWAIQETETYPYKPWQTAPPYVESGLVSQSTTITGKSVDGGTVYLEIGDRYKVSMKCNGNEFTFTVPALQSGEKVRLYAVSDDKWQSPYTDEFVSYPGKGTEADPYLVYTASDLQGVYKRGYYKLMNDVDLTEWINAKSPKEGWPAIGKNGISEIYFDGGGHTVSGLWCKTDAGYNGLFSNFPGGYIRNLNVKVADGKSVSGGDYTGILIGRFAKGTINNVTVEGNVASTCRGGGIVGGAEDLTINSASFAGKVTSTSNDAKLGGIAGETNGGKLTRCSANADIEATGENTIAGGLVGVTEATDSITKCYSEGTLAATGAKSYVGGLVGINNGEGLIENCYSTADATSTLYAAGLVAYNYGKVSNSYSKGNVNSEFYGAGAVGYNDGAKATVNNLVAGNPQVNVTDKSGWSIRVLGGFKNGAAQPGENNYALSTMILSVNGVPKKVTDNILDGYAKTEDELKSKATYEKLGWSFSRVWKIDEGKAWPTLDMTVYGLVTSVTLDQKTLTLKKGQTATLKATVKPDDATNKTIAWSSSDTSIATVKDGVVRGVGNGKATIIATSTDGTNLADSAIVTVYAPVNDTIVLKDTTTLKNKTIMYPVYLNNEDPVSSFQFDVYLPDGMDIATNSKGKYDIQFAGRQEDTHSITSNKVSTGAIRVIAFSIANDNFSGKSGALVNIPITIGDVAKGDYNISIRNIVLADASEKEYYCQDATGVIHVNDVIMGDANSDGKVSLADVNSTVNYIAEKPSENFYFAAADMNNNGIINVSDVNAIVNVLAEVKTSASAKKNVFAVANEVTTNDKMYCSNITVAPGETATLPVNLVNSGKYCSFQFDILLPKGITVDSTVNQSGKVRYSASLVTSRCVDHSLTSNLIRGNRYRVIVFSLSNTDVEGVDGPVVNIKLKAEKDAAEGDYTLKMERVVLATADEKEYYPADSESTVTVSTDTGINGITVDPSSVKIYDLQGRKVNKPTQGVYIVNGKKVVIK